MRTIITVALVDGNECRGLRLINKGDVIYLINRKGGMTWIPKHKIKQGGISKKVYS